MVWGAKSQQVGSWLAQFPCTGSLYSVSPVQWAMEMQLLRGVTPWDQGQGASCCEIQAPVREEGGFKVSRWHTDRSPSCSGAPGEALASPVYELPQELHIHLAIDELPGSRTLAGRPAPKNSLRLKAFKTFQAFCNQYITTFIYHTRASLKGLLMEAFQIQTSALRIKSLVLCTGEQHLYHCSSASSWCLHSTFTPKFWEPRMSDHKA